MPTIRPSRLAAVRLTVYLLIAGIAAGCGASDHADDAKPFLGTWTYATVAQTLSCPGSSVGTSTRHPTWNLVLSAGGGGLRYQAGDGCPYQYMVSGSRATIVGGQSCATAFFFPDGSTGTLTVMPQEGTLTMTAPGALEEVASGTATLVGAPGTFPCTFDATGMLAPAGT